VLAAARLAEDFHARAQGAQHLMSDTMNDILDVVDRLGGARSLGELLGERDDEDELRARADAGDILAVERLGELSAEGADEDELRAQARAGNRYAAKRLAELLAERGDDDELRARADAGDEYAARRLAELLKERGDDYELRARADAGDEYAARRLAELLAERGDLDGAIELLRAPAAAGVVSAGSLSVDWKLVELLAERGDDDELRARADAGDRMAASKLVERLSDNEALLRREVQAGTRGAAKALLGLLRRLGRHAEADRLRAITRDYRFMSR
jgi:hypothetical protein